MPDDLTGKITVQIAQWRHAFEITNHTNTRIVADLPPEPAQALLSAMDHAALITITAGKQVFGASLSGVAKATRAFRECAGLRHADNAPINSPFD